jgi:hypothetical protein
VVEGCGRFGYCDKDRILEKMLASLGVSRPSYPSTTIVKSPGATHKVWHPPVYYGKPKYRDPAAYGFAFDWTDIKTPGYHTIEPGVFRPTAAWAVYKQAKEQLENSIIWPVNSWHPLQRRYSVGSRKKYYRTLGNRLNRHKTRQILKSSIIDEDWDGFFPHKNEVFNWWDIY